MRAGRDMPEGDTVYRAAKKLDEALSGQVLTRSDFRIPSLATSDISGAVVLETISRGKHLLMRFDNGLTLRTHLKNILLKLEARSKLEAVLIAIREGRIQLPEELP